MSYSDNAIMAKARAGYGKRLLIDDYKRLASCHSISELTACLKSHPAYSEVLEQAQEDMIHRGQLEMLIRRRVFNIFTGLLKYSYDDRLFLELYIRQNEISQLLALVRLLNAGAMDRYIVSLPVYLSKHMSFDLFKMAKARSFDELLTHLEHSEYYEIVGRFRPYGSAAIDIVGFERALLTHHYRTFISHVQKAYKGKMCEDLLRIIYWQIDFYNIRVIWRLKSSFKYSPEKIQKHLLPIQGNLPRRLIQQAVAAADLAEFIPIMRQSRVMSGIFPDNEFNAVRATTLTDKARLSLTQRPFRFSNRPVVVAVLYMTLLEIEIANLVHIIEGVRYGVSAEEIFKLLVVQQ